MKVQNTGFGYLRHLAMDLIPDPAALSVPMKPWFLRLSSWKSIPRIPLPPTNTNNDDLLDLANYEFNRLLVKFLDMCALFKPGLDHLQEISLVYVKPVIIVLYT